MAPRCAIGTVLAVDPLADVLDLGRVRGALLASVRACAPWGLELPESNGAALHAVTAGTAWLRVDLLPLRRVEDRLGVRARTRSENDQPLHAG